MINLIKNWMNRNWFHILLLSVVSFFIIVVLYPRIVHTIPPGHVGVMWYRFFDGTDTLPENIKSEGLTVIFPWDRVYIYNARLQTVPIVVEGLSSDGLNVSVEFIVRFTIDSRNVGYLHKSIGPDFAKTLVTPQIRELALRMISSNQAADLYSERRSRTAKRIEREFSEKMKGVATNLKFDGYFIKTDIVLMAKIRLPEFVQRAIEEKEKVRHVSESYDYRLVVEDKERQRKRLEAEGIRGFQEIVSGGITDSYLRWRGIQATLELSKSNNTKVVIVGGKDGLPLILNTEGVNTKNVGQTESPLNPKTLSSNLETIGEPTDLTVEQNSEVSVTEIEALPIQTKRNPTPKLEKKIVEEVKKTNENSDNSSGHFLKDIINRYKITNK
ncbi:MAG: prohibitin family protein [Paracoccaceae bacterium]